ncbi:PIN domain-containing protein [Microbacterium protaetiae]|uniref:PIN domain-containing protein n=1 Tax=Microbacterium protaetiae TaxID=2509458 RepID=A0A4P6ECZ5_9MICO|nr:PIN domain-containing protein [Microbacterium protaetiae]QAY59536.1 PIN domain-containing protein [Microbacterium protaetiae]
MAIFAAVLDACVMVPVSLCDILLRLAEERMFRPIWSERILDEATEAITEVHPDLDEGLVRRRVQYMTESFPGACVSGTEQLELSLRLPDPDDRHVLAAAIRSRADAIVTANLKDFPDATLSAFDVEAIHPDDFLMSQLDMRGRVVMDVLHAQAAATRNPTLSVDDVLTSLVRAGVPSFVDEARRRL